MSSKHFISSNLSHLLKFSEKTRLFWWTTVQIKVRGLDDNYYLIWASAANLFLRFLLSCIVSSFLDDKDKVWEMAKTWFLNKLPCNLWTWFQLQVMRRCLVCSEDSTSGVNLVRQVSSLLVFIVLTSGLWHTWICLFLNTQFCNS